jgi:hypothetical protein
MQSVQPAGSRVTVKRQSLCVVSRKPNSEGPRSSNLILSEPKIEDKNYSCEEPAPLYSVLPNGEKTVVIVAGSFAALISPLSSSIYLPALESLARDMDVSVSLINLTVTTYLVR